MLETYLKKQLDKKGLLLMTHIVLGYPSVKDSLRIIESMVEAGVDLMELQIPFSEPIADGPVILQANQNALSAGASVQQCFDLAKAAAKTFSIPFLFMSYYNILYQFGIDGFADATAESGLQGAIVPDLPPEEGEDYLSAMDRNGLSPIFIFSPNTSVERMKYLASVGKGFIYCVARKGVTGSETDFSSHLNEYLGSCRQATDLPLALGFGVKEKKDIDFLRGRVDIAVIGTQTIRLIDAEGIEAVGPFIRSLRE